MFPLAKPSQEKFAAQLIRAIREVDANCQFEYDADEFRLVQQGNGATVNLANIYHEHCALPRRERKEHLNALAQVFAVSQDDKLPEDFDEARPNLRPRIYNRSTFAFIDLEHRLKGEPNELDIPLYPLGSHLYSSLAYDTEHAMRSISNEELDKWGVTYYEALEIACRNLDEASMAYTKLGGGFHSAVSGDSYDSARILLVDKVRSMEVEGDHIALVPQRDAMYVAGSEDVTSLNIMFDLTAQTLADEPRPLSPIPLMLADGEWVDWEPPHNHAVREKFDELQLQFFGGLYHQQKELLDALLEAGEELPFVASFSGIQQENSETVHSYCVWGRGVDSLLPQTEFVVFVDDGGMVASGRWADVVDVVSDLIVPDSSYYPIRYRVREYPSDEQLAAIGRVPPFDV